MADTNIGMPVFQFQPEVVQGGGSRASGASPQLGIVGGGGTAGVQMFSQTQDIGAGSTLPAFLEQEFAPKLQAVKMQKFWAGFTAARAGATAAEISKESPWYSNIFGPTSFEAGASAFSVMRAGSEMETQFMSRIGELRTRPPEEVAVELNTLATSVQTGNLYTDALIQKNMMDRAGPMMDMHAKARYAWQQEELVKMKLSTGLEAARAAQASMSAYAQLGKDAPNQIEAGLQREELQRNYLTSLQPDAQQNPESVDKFIKLHVRSLADNGLWFALDSLRASGIESMMDPDDVSVLTNYVNTSWNKFKNKAILDDGMIQDIAHVKFLEQQGFGGQPVVDAMTEINKRFQAKHGGRAYFEAEEVADAAGRAVNSYAADRRRDEAERKAADKVAATEAAKQAARNETIGVLTTAAYKGDLATFARSKGVESDDVDRVLTDVYTAVNTSNPNEAAQILVRNFAAGADPAPTLAKDLQGAVMRSAGTQPNDAFLSAYKNWQRLYNSTGMKLNPATGKVEQSDVAAGQATAMMYYGKDINARMLKLDRLTKSVPFPVAYALSWGDDVREADVRGVDSEETKRNRQAVIDGVNSFDDSAWSRIFGTGTKLTDNNKTILAAAISKEFADFDTLNLEDRIVNAIRVTKANGMEMHGRYLWHNERGQKPVFAYLNSNEKAAAPLVDLAITRALKKSGVTVKQDTSVQVVRVADQGPVPILYVSAMTDDGWVSARVSGDDIKKIDKAEQVERERLRERYAPPGFVFDEKQGRAVPSITIQPKL